MTNVDAAPSQVDPEDIQLAIAYVLDNGDFEPYADILREHDNPEFGMVDETGKHYANVALNALTFHFGSCTATATAPSSYPPNRKVQLSHRTLGNIVAPFAIGSVQW